ncbi:MAG: hypothetical protein EOO68_04940 [Moraxellaceae bacterium]|nr:MAG: hypothetical protein EOO68_04940 [Moraxellaceae bacterium]
MMQLLLTSTGRTKLFPGNMQLFLPLLLCFVTAFASAQSQATSLDQFLTDQHNAHPEITGLLPVEQLISGVQRVIYAEEGSVKIFGANPVCLQTTAQQAASVPALGLPVEHVELLTVKIKSQGDLSHHLDLSAFTDFPALKYIHVLSETALPASALSSYVINVPAGASVFYSTQLTN